MIPLARQLLILCTALTVFVASALVGGGRVLCVDGPGHVALEAAHDPGCCPSAEERHDASDPQQPVGGCSDVSADVDLARETLAGPSAAEHAPYLLAPAGADAVALAPAAASTVTHFDSAAHPPPRSDLVHLGGIVLLI